MITSTFIDRIFTQCISRIVCSCALLLTLAFSFPASSQSFFEKLALIQFTTMSHYPTSISAGPEIHADDIVYTPAHQEYFHVGTETLTTSINTYDWDYCNTCNGIFSYGWFVNCNTYTHDRFDWIRLIAWTPSYSGIFETNNPYGYEVTWEAANASTWGVTFNASIFDYNQHNPNSLFPGLDHSNMGDEEVLVTSTQPVKAFKVGTNLTVYSEDFTLEQGTKWSDDDNLVLVFSRNNMGLKVETVGNSYMVIDDEDEKFFNAQWEFISMPPIAALPGQNQSDVAAFNIGTGHKLTVNSDNPCYAFCGDGIDISITLLPWPISIDINFPIDPYSPTSEVAIGYGLSSPNMYWSESKQLSLDSHGWYWGEKTANMGLLQNKYKIINSSATGVYRDAEYRILGESRSNSIGWYEAPGYYYPYGNIGGANPGSSGSLITEFRLGKPIFKRHE